MIIQVGVYPDPIGGISIYIKRMKKYMEKLGMDNLVWDLSDTRKDDENVINCRLRYLPFKLLFQKNVDLVHYNICGVKSKIYIGIFNKILFRKIKKILTIHGDSKDLFGKHEKMLTMALNSFDAIICVKEGDKKYLIKKGVLKPIYEINAFVFPIQDSNYNISKTTLQFIKDKDFIITASASSIAFYHEQDLYGIDMCIQLLNMLKSTCGKKDVGFLFCLPEVNDHGYYLKLLELIEEYNLKNDFLFLHKKQELYPIIKESDLFLRPTNSDGYGVSIAESIFYNVPAIASDVCKRPEGTIIFKSRDIDDLYTKTIDVIENYDGCKEKIKNIKFKNNADMLLNIYHKITII